MASNSEGASQPPITKKRPLKMKSLSPKTIALSRTVNSQSSDSDAPKRDCVALSSPTVPTIERQKDRSEVAVDFDADQLRKEAEAAEAMVALYTPTIILRDSEIQNTSNVTLKHMTLPLSTEEIVPASRDITETTSLNFKDLEDLFADRVCVLWVRNYISKKVCKKMNKFFTDVSADVQTSNEMLTLNNLGDTHGENSFSNEPHRVNKDSSMAVRSADKSNLQCFGINSYGRPLNINQVDKYKYQETALSTIRQLRIAISPYMSPIDKFRLDLDEIWPGKILQVNRIEPDSAGDGQTLHFDKMCSTKNEIESQFVGNIYMITPSSGDLVIWNDIPIASDLEEANLPKTWRTKLKDQKVKVRPERGDLVLFNNRRPHIVEGSDQELPSSNSVRIFIGLTKTKDVYLWV